MATAVACGGWIVLACSLVRSAIGAGLETVPSPADEAIRPPPLQRVLGLVLLPVEARLSFCPADAASSGCDPNAALRISIRAFQAALGSLFFVLDVPILSPAVSSGLDHMTSRRRWRSCGPAWKRGRVGERLRENQVAVMRLGLAFDVVVGVEVVFLMLLESLLMRVSVLVR